MITQVYGIRSTEDARMLVELGIDHIGIPYGKKKADKWFLDFDQAREIFECIEDEALKVGLTATDDLEEIIDTMKILMPDILHLAGDITKFPPQKIIELKKNFPRLKIMQALPANDINVFKYVKHFESVSDYFLIDTSTKKSVVIGATGITHDLDIDRKIVLSTSVPCIIAGGLSPANVSEAIRYVRPYGVDTLTYTNLEEPIGKRTKDPLKVKGFLEAVRRAELE